MNVSGETAATEKAHLSSHRRIIVIIIFIIIIIKIIIIIVLDVNPRRIVDGVFRLKGGDF